MEIPVFDYCDGKPVPTVQTKTKGPEIPDETKGPNNEDYEG